MHNNEAFTRLKSQVRLLTLISISSLLGFLYLLLKDSLKDDSLTLKKLTITDDHDRPVIVLGAPIAEVSGRKRTDSLVGILLIDSKGHDRLFIGKDGKLQMGGVLQDRQSEGWSYLINDTLGDERAGFGFRDDEDAVGLGLDYGGANGLEAIYLNASNENAYILINGNVTSGHRDRIVLWNDSRSDVSQIKIGDSTKDDKILLKSKSGRVDFYMVDSTRTKKSVLTSGKD